MFSHFVSQTIATAVDCGYDALRAVCAGTRRHPVTRSEHFDRGEAYRYRADCPIDHAVVVRRGHSGRTQILAASGVEQETRQDTGRAIFLALR
jgi:hypothetical protein